MEDITFLLICQHYLSDLHLPGFLNNVLQDFQENIGIKFVTLFSLVFLNTVIFPGFCFLRFLKM